MKTTETAGKITETVGEKRIGASAALTTLITVVSLFAATAIVVGVPACVAHPAVAVLCGAGTLLMLACFAYSAVREAGAVQQWRFGCSLSLAVAFAFFALWSGCVPPVASLAILPLCVCAAILTATFSRIRGNAVLYVIAGGVGVWMLQLLLGLLGVLPFSPPHLYFAVVYALAAGLAFGRAFVIARRRAARGARTLAGYGTAILLSVCFMLFGGYFSSLFSTLITAVLLLSAAVLCIWDMGWYTRWPFCVAAVLVCVALVLTAGLLTGLFTVDGWDSPEPVAMGGGYMIVLIGYAVIALGLAISKPFGKNIYARAALIVCALAYICIVLFCGGLSDVGIALAVGAATLVCLGSTLLCFDRTRKSVWLWIFVLPVSVAVMTIPDIYMAGKLLYPSHPFFLVVAFFTAMLTVVGVGCIESKYASAFPVVFATFLANVILALALVSVWSTKTPIEFLLMAAFCVLVPYVLYEKHKEVFLLNLSLLGFFALALNAGLLTGALPRGEFSVDALMVGLVIGGGALLVGALKDSYDCCPLGVWKIAKAIRSILSAATCVACAMLVLFGGFLDGETYFKACVVVVALVLGLLIWRGHLLPLNFFAITALMGLVGAGGAIGVIERNEVYTKGMRDILFTGVLVPMIPAVPGALILTLRDCGNVLKCQKARHAFACAVCSAVCLLLCMIGGRFTGFAKTAVCAVAIGMMLFSVYAVFEKRSRY